MPKKIDAYECNHCGTQYPEGEAAAIVCENSHTPIGALTILNASFRNLNNVYGIERGLARLVPVTLRVRFGPGHGEFATYKLDHVGFRGV